jgi:hypothetical protein
MAGLGSSALVVMQEHLRNLVSQGYMTVAELATYHVPEDPAPPVLAGGYVVACVAFYEREFSVPSHGFLCRWGLSPTLIYGTIFSAPDYGRVRTQKQRCWVVWTSMSDLGPKSIPIFLF